MESPTLASRLKSAGITTRAINLHGRISHDLVWNAPVGWREMSGEHLPSMSLVAANLEETVNGQSSATVTSAWDLDGAFDPVSLLSEFIDPLPPEIEVVSVWQDDPSLKWYGASVTSNTIYKVGGNTLAGMTRFDIVVDYRSDKEAGGVLLQRTYNSPTATSGAHRQPAPAAITSTFLPQVRD